MHDVFLSLSHPSTVNAVDGNSFNEANEGCRNHKNEKRLGLGCTGAVGPAGAAGLVGPTGPAGLVGPSGLAGPMGPINAPFAVPVDSGESLSFNYTLGVTLGDIGSTATPFVVMPDGRVLEGGAQVTVLGLNPVSSVVILDPQFGRYTVGVRFDNGVTAIGGNLVMTAGASCTAPVTTIFFNNGLVSGLSNNSQTAGHYTYGSPLVL